MLVFTHGYRQVTCTPTNIEWFMPNSMNILSACSQCANIGGILSKKNKSQKLNIYISQVSEWKHSPVVCKHVVIIRTTLHSHSVGKPLQERLVPIRSIFLSVSCFYILKVNNYLNQANILLMCHSTKFMAKCKSNKKHIIIKT